MKFPVLVQFEFHPASKEAAAAAEYLHDVLNADPAVPGLQIPTYFTPDDGSGEPPEPRVATEADRVLVVLLADDHLATAARKPTKSGTTWGEYATKLRSLTEAAGHRFMPVQLTEDAWPVDTRLSDTNFLRAWAINGVDERHKLIARRLVHLLIRRLRPRTDNENAPPVTIFLSHTKMDLEHEPRVVKALLAHLTATQPEKTWFDSGDISTGSRFVDLRGIDWVIVGGESGPRSRPMDSAWVTEIRDQCLAARVPFFFKQWGGTNKKKAGKLLEGRIWNEMPRLVPAAPAKPTRRLPIARTGPCLPDAAT